MTVAEKRFCIVLLINTAVAVLYVIGNSRIRQKEKNTDDVSLPGSRTVVFFGGTGV